MVARDARTGASPKDLGRPNQLSKNASDLVCSRLGGALHHRAICPALRYGTAVPTSPLRNGFFLKAPLCQARTNPKPLPAVRPRMSCRTMNHFGTPHGLFKNLPRTSSRRSRPTSPQLLTCNGKRSYRTANLTRMRHKRLKCGAPCRHINQRPSCKRGGRLTENAHRQGPTCL